MKVTLDQLKILHELGFDIGRYYAEEMKMDNCTRAIVCGEYGCEFLLKDNNNQ